MKRTVHPYLQTAATCLLILCILFLSGCFSRNYIRHLASDACLVVPNQSTQKEILSFMGQPDQRKTIDAENEEWIYLQANKNLLRKTPFIGQKVGSQNYDVVVINFKGDIATVCTYRQLTEKDFKDSGIKPNVQLNAE